MHKLRSLSIGEHIATAFANILRHCLTAEALENTAVYKHWGYVDDTLTFVVGEYSDVEFFIHTFDSAIFPLKWDHDVQLDCQHFLDVQIYARFQEAQDGCGSIRFETTMYRKPSFMPHYLAALSDHPPSHKSDIFRCEAYRALLLCAKQQYFQECIQQILGFLSSAGYPEYLFKVPLFCSETRALAFKKLEQRKPKDHGYIVTAKLRNNVVMSLPFNVQLESIGIAKVFRSTLGSIVPVELKLGWSVKINSMRRLYRLNWPCVPQSMGNG